MGQPSFRIAIRILVTASGFDEQFHIGHQTVFIEDAVVGDGFTCAAEP